ncbi:ornithine cyclodeaminase family protein [uncultured Sphingosinicella sp.]|uniref:ornithine cyclodeaminase family protein n=1 Tax=uncultured Sphingosinicella sp. TaxID=478748 RepID=UPI0030DC61D1|tara:strand:- start:8181 stop:9167 length:987 start_codon:yes stop_codon:yes gene_type:complete
MHEGRDVRIFGADDVWSHLTYEACIAAMRDAMVAFSEGRTPSVPRTFLDLAGGNMFGAMVGSLGEGDMFGAKLINLFPGNVRHGKPSHLGLVALFDPADGSLSSLIDAAALTAIRTASASAAATDALARPDARTLAVLGYGEQAETHIRAILTVRPIERVRAWGRDPERCARFSDRIAACGVSCTPVVDIAGAVAGADIVCTTTAAVEPILYGRWIVPGTHINVVGFAGSDAAEIDADLVLRARYIADSRASVFAEAGEFRSLLRNGVITDAHIVAEIGDVYSGRATGRICDDDITLYRSLGHIVQDLAAARALVDLASGTALRSVRL